jgi:hypothetical protein
MHQRMPVKWQLIEPVLRAICSPIDHRKDAQPVLRAADGAERKWMATNNIDIRHVIRISSLNRWLVQSIDSQFGEHLTRRYAQSSPRRDCTASRAFDYECPDT